MNDPLFSRLHILILTATLVTICIFVSFPGLDLAITALFYGGSGQFLMTTNHLAVAVNAMLRIGLTAGFLAIILMLVLWRLLGIRPASGFGNWGFATANFLIGPGLIVNGILKSWVGRARPVHLAEFGGTGTFTPMLEISDQCARNCSFSSGEVAQTATFVFTVLVLAWPHLQQRGKWAGGLLGAGLICLSVFLRIGLGRHFMSDALASVAIAALVSLATYRLFDIGAARENLTRTTLLRDLKVTGTALRGVFPRKRRIVSETMAPEGNRAPAHRSGL